jgi:hypothetical protein
MRKPKSPHGTVTVQVYKDRIRLVWTCPVNRKRIYLALGLSDSAINRNAAQQKALFIQNDMGSGNYDPTLKKYKSESQIGRDRLMTLPQTAWYRKSLPTFIDALATVRRSLWSAKLFEMSTQNPTAQKVRSETLQLWTDPHCYAA